jgi:retinol dehydrogenase-13
MRLYIAPPADFQYSYQMPKYFKDYTLKNVMAMVKNSKLDPVITPARAEGHLAVITGATAGIGYYTAHKYASMGADLLCINRSREKSEQLAAEISGRYGTRCDFLVADFSSLAQTREVSTSLLALDRDIDVLIHNAGLYLTTRSETDEGFETVWAVNHLSSFLMNELLLPKLAAQSRGRIIMVNSEGHRFAPWGLRTDDLNWEKRRYSGLGAYGSAKLAQLLCIKVTAQRLAESPVTINAMHPGAVKTDSGKDNGRFYRWYKEKVIERNFRSAEISAEALYTLGIGESFCHESGKFYHLTTLEDPAPPAEDLQAAREIYEISRVSCGLA